MARFGERQNRRSHCFRMDWVALACLVIGAQVSCSPAVNDQPALSGDWVGTVVKEGTITTVRNTAGSVWGGVATLVVEASIGVAEGEDEYLLGRIGGVWATEREILILDAQVPAVRVYDYQGAYLRQIGAGGEGPGEYARPSPTASTFGSPTLGFVETR